MAQHCMFKRLN